MWGNSDLLTNIQNEIRKAGGRTRLGYYLTHHEAPEWFPEETKKHFRWAMGSLLYNLNKKILNQSKLTWTEEQIQYIRDNWKRFHIYVISKEIGKSYAAIRSKARSIMTPEEYNNRFYNREIAGVAYKEKSKHWKRYQK